MKICLQVVACLSALILCSCEPSNETLYKDVMSVHDEVMPKMNDIYNRKQDLLAQIKATPDMAGDKKKEIEARISNLDSASDGMMIWMRNFNPPPDTVGEEKLREYLKSEMVKVQKVKDDITKALGSTE